jgi:hypothetical protein
VLIVAEIEAAPEILAAISLHASQISQDFCGMQAKYCHKMPFRMSKRNRYEQLEPIFCW